jgi:hypothetical protein
VETHLRETFGPLVFTTTIPTSIKVEEAHGRFLSVLDYAPKSPGAVAYQSLAPEILNHGRSQERTGPAPKRSDAADDNRGERRAVEPTEPVDDQVETEEQSRGGDDVPAAKVRTPRSKKSVGTVEKVRAAKLHLPESVFDALHLAALKKRTTASALAAEILRRGLPKLKIVDETQRPASKDGAGESAA